MHAGTIIRMRFGFWHIPGLSKFDKHGNLNPPGYCPDGRCLPFLMKTRNPWTALSVGFVLTCVGCAAPWTNVDTGSDGESWVSSPASSQSKGDAVEYDLTISERTLSPAGRPVRALTVNGAIPAPVLRFREGDVVRITVRNALRYEETSIHWHGLLVPNAMDGVPYLTTPPIPPGGKRVFEFRLRQSGTYWYHSHSGLQEQRGVYGAIVIEPREPDDLKVDREHVVVLSDWTNESPEEVMRTLMRGSEWYALKKGNMQSLFGAWQAGQLGEYFDRQYSRLPAMDISDIAYDAFLANGARRVHLDAKPGERVLLRIVNSGASTYFHITSAAGPLTIVAADGPRVEPVAVKRLLIGMAETYDVIVTMPDEGAIEVRTTAHDGSGHASIVLGDGPVRAASDPPKPEIYLMDEMINAGLASIIPKRAKNAANEPRPFAPYALLRSTKSTRIVAPEQEASVRKLTMRLTGNMQRYLWGFDNKTLSEDAVIPVSKGEVLRIKFINDTMMHHPLHLHGHFFRVLNGQGDHAPLKHTVDVPPMGRRTIEWIADEEGGDWFFHCHMLYHMDAGMARVFSYRGQGAGHIPKLDPKLIDPWHLMVDGSVQTHMTMGMVMFMRGRNDYYLSWDSGLSQVHDDREIDVAWSRYLDPNWSTVLGFRFTTDPRAENRAFAGVRYRLPYLFHTSWIVDSEGDARVTIEKELQLTARAAIFGEIEYDTNTYTEWSAGAIWTLNKQFGLITEYHSDHGTGVGMTFSF